MRNGVGDACIVVAIVLAILSAFAFFALSVTGFAFALLIAAVIVLALGVLL